ncbi:nickel pincer cofactor biosynthesis protein LarB [Schaalia sp. 19OD2882]|uniref:nickel pincer cofactor biosynthesis protein LarB n=1 Tax=Schaalia sp. 19OD2882 TaxID=2794089 RepID=UPI001C1F0CDD|nr:nickel pincer cofactor biosynthesis protein LarB [Schaalia sp. 19OD2882]QWW19987.1 nickel pincer cofactor biosynthesis protein LarB [Schaalia sp. 19OD2882]
MELNLDFDRHARRGYAEAVYCESKTPEQCQHAARQWAERARRVGDDSALGTLLFTRADDTHARAVLAELPDALHDPVARMLAWPPTPPEPTGGRVLVVCAGTSDLPVAREAAMTARHLGRRVETLNDVGVAGLHRILARREALETADVIVVVAGMEGALVPVVAGLVKAPVVAVPTSVGYGATFGGVTALLSMLSSCAPGVGVVNIDNGYGAGHLAAQIAAVGALSGGAND